MTDGFDLSGLSEEERARVERQLEQATEAGRVFSDPDPDPTEN